MNVLIPPAVCLHKMLTLELLQSSTRRVFQRHYPGFESCTSAQVPPTARQACRSRRISAFGSLFSRSFLHQANRGAKLAVTSTLVTRLCSIFDIPTVFFAGFFEIELWGKMGNACFLRQLGASPSRFGNQLDSFSQLNT